jgi:AraC-like DNA-binding protein
MIIIFEECGRNATQAARVFSKRFPDRNHPGHTVILRVIARTHETGQVLPNRKESGGPPMTARIVENEEAILNTVEEDGTRSLAEIASPLGISSSSVYRVLKNNRKHPYHYIRVQHLQPEDYPTRREFCTWFL